jgi:phosphatidate phosphatase PAH1
MTVTGDGTRADGTIWVWAPETRVVVFDIDGTLTPGDREIIKRAVWGSAVKVRSGAADVVRHWVANSAITPIYLTGRPYLFSADTRRWLERHEFPSGPLITADSLRQALPSSGGVGLYKETWLKQLIGVQKLSIIAAYGNADTDICAFARAGISPATTYIFGDDSRRCDQFDPPQWIADFVDHLGGLSPRGTDRRAR